MSSAASRRVDLRAFRWHLAPLERKLNVSIDSARMKLGILRQREADLQRTMRTIETQRHAVITSAASADAVLDPRTRTDLLYYLVQQAQVLESRSLEAARLDLDITAAREACGTLQRRLACVQELRGVAQTAYAAEQLRADAKEADLAWIALSARLVPDSSESSAA